MVCGNNIFVTEHGEKDAERGNVFEQIHNVWRERERDRDPLRATMLTRL